ncbi:hypothetical protein [Devosia sp. CAU 1758]
MVLHMQMPPIQPDPALPDDGVPGPVPPFGPAPTQPGESEPPLPGEDEPGDAPDFPPGRDPFPDDIEPDRDQPLPG